MMNNNQPIIDEIRKKVVSEFGGSVVRGFIRRGKCPQCQHKELWTSYDYPYVLRCSRLNKCGYEESTRTLYPDIFDEWSKRFQKTQARPNAAADAYLKYARGIDPTSMEGAYTQESYKDNDQNIKSATIRFSLPGGGWWERIIDKPYRFKKKANFKFEATYGGHLWSHPDDKMDDFIKADEIWITEGIFDALSLRQAFQNHDDKPTRMTGSAMSTSNYPSKWLSDLKKAIADREIAGKGPTLIFAFDGGPAGANSTHKFVKIARKEGWNASASQYSVDGENDQNDWNDLLIKGLLTTERIDEYRWAGEVTIAETPVEKAIKIYERKKWSSFPFIFRCQQYWAEFSATKIEEAILLARDKNNINNKLSKSLDKPFDERASFIDAVKRSAIIKRIANCSFKILYVERDEIVDETRYLLQIKFPNSRKIVKGYFLPSALTTSSEFKKRLFAFGGVWLGNAKQLDHLIINQSGNIKQIEPINFTGYSKDHKAWILGDLSIKNGRTYPINDEGYFDLGTSSVKLRSSDRLLNIEYDQRQLDIGWIDALWTSYRAKGLIALTFWTMAFFAEQIREQHQSLGFLEIIGIPGSGKSTLLEFLWKLAGRDQYEGFDPAKATMAGLSRSLGNVSNLPVVLIEGDRADDVLRSRRFEWDELKTAYNGRSVRSRGVKNNGMDTYEPPFRASIIISQNYPVDASPAILERICQIDFDKEGWNQQTKQSAITLSRWPASKLSGFIVHVIKHEKRWIEMFNQRVLVWESNLLERSSNLHNQRIIKNHSQVLAGFDCLTQLLPSITSEMKKETQEIIFSMAENREERLKGNHAVIDRFWDIVEFIILNEDNPDSEYYLNKSRQPDEYIAINLPHFEQQARNLGIQQVPNIETLKKYLPMSKSPKFQGNKVVFTPYGKSVRCFVFEQNKNAPIETQKNKNLYA